MAIKDWSLTPGDNGPIADGNPEGMAPSLVNDRDREEKSSIRAWYEDAQWIEYGHTITRVSDTQFSADGADYTGIYQVGRKVKLVGATTVAVLITAVVFGTDTVVTVEGATVPASLTGASVGILTATDNAVPLSYIADATLTKQMVLLKNPETFTPSFGAFVSKTSTTLTNAGAKMAYIRVNLSIDITVADATRSRITFRSRYNTLSGGPSNDQIVADLSARKDAGYTDDVSQDLTATAWVNYDSATGFQYAAIRSGVGTLLAEVHILGYAL